MKHLFFVVYLFLFVSTDLRSQETLKLASEIYNAVDELNNSMEDLGKMKNAIKDIEDKKAPNISDNEWSELASKFRTAADEMKKTPLPTDFDKNKYAVSIDELKNCKLKDVTLKKLNGYLQELRDAQDRGQQSITLFNSVSRKIKISREVLRYCINVSLPRTPSLILQ